jgi:hypothetical protein
MARPERHDADYFPFYARDGKTLFILESKYQCKGTGFFTNVLRFLTLQPEHHICIQDESDRLYFFSKTKCDEESGIDMLNIMAKTGKIHSDLWVSCKVIVSERLLESLSDAYRNRKNSIITIDQIIVSYKQNEITDTGNPQARVVSDADNPQTKLKKTKVKQSIKETPDPDPEPPPKKQLVLEKLKETMLKFPDQRYQHNIQLFVQANWNKNDDAIIHCLNQLINSKKSISYPKSYLESILAVENGNFNERESIQEHATHKADIPVQDIPRLGEVLKVMGAR